MPKYIFILSFCFFMIVSCSETHKVEVLSTDEYLFPMPSGNTYKAKLELFGKINCDIKAHMTYNHKNYVSKVYISGVINSELYFNDWYGDTLGIKIEGCDTLNLSTLTAKVTYFK